MFSLLKELSEAAGLSGKEDSIRKVVYKHIKDYVDDVKVGKLGELITLKKGKDSKLKVMLVAHMDQIGMMVKNITKEGFIQLGNTGGLDPYTLISQRYKVITSSGKVYKGIIGTKAIHLLKGDEKRKIKLKDLYLDIGCDSKEEVENLGVELGDVVIFDRDLEQLADGKRFTGPALDDRIGVFILIKILEKLKDVKLDYDLYIVFSTQEEIWLRGAKTAANYIKPDIAIAIDTTFAKCPYSKDIEAPTKMGNGCAITKGPTTNIKLTDFIINKAKENKVKYQIEVSSHISGTDAYIIQTINEGVATAVLSVPSRYLHSSIEIIDKEDVNSAIDILFYSLKEMHKVDLSYELV